ncbi:hypothetical protein VBY75_08450 [Idiomarina sp. HB]|uniref:hypothetical protein n=1 Tax=Idiomarina sp. HB TaxID=3110479 RepID=UPI003A802137
MSWLRRINSVLKKEPETWLAYLHGQKFDSLQHLKEAQTKHKGRFIRILVWFLVSIKKTRLKYSPQKIHCEYLAYAGTRNQKNSLDKTIEYLRCKGHKVSVIAPEEILTEEETIEKGYFAIHHSPLELLKSLLLLFLRFRKLRAQLKNKNRKLISERLDNFLKVYNYLVYFDRLLSDTDVKMVIVSNDHNLQNRSFLALARSYNIKTIYMQHASVSNLFPALNVDYAFLDGLSALETYRECEKNYPSTDPPKAKRQVYLSGQKKYLKLSTISDVDRVGLALNSLDSLDDAQKLISFLAAKNYEIKLRWHPSLSGNAIERMYSRFEGFEIMYSNPREESLIEFFSSVSCLIAGNSSIHLEAALCNLLPIYYEITDSEIPDYYSYVKNGIAIRANDFIDIYNIIKKFCISGSPIDNKKIQYYSSTFGTEWENREGELVAEVISNITNNLTPPIKANSI